MSVRSPSPSQFRPKAGIDQSVLENNKALLAEVDRRKFLRGSLSLGALAMTRCRRRCARCPRSTIASRR
jgi:hypothetical protein